jgi:serine/threonine protein kinase
MEEFKGFDEEKMPFGFSKRLVIYEYAYIVIPYIKGVSWIEYLIHKVDTKSNVSQEDTRCLLYHIVEALHELETLTGLSHMDLKPDNIMITTKGKVKLIDFCHSFPSTKLTSRSYGTEEYTAPEIFYVRRNPGLYYLPR